MTFRIPMLIAILALSAQSICAQSTRSGSDFELETLRKKLETTRESLELVAVHLNFGDIYTARRQSALAVDSYSAARSLAAQLRKRSRENSDLTLYATATAYEGLAFAKLRRTRESFDRFEEALRYLGDSGKIWNLYSSAMLLNGHPKKAAALAQSAVRLAEDDASRTPSPRTLLDLEIYRYALASAESDSGDKAAALETLAAISSNLERPAFDPIRSQVEKEEKFEIYSSVRGDADAYVSLFNRVNLRIAKIREERGELLLAREAYERVLALRSDDANALAALARLGSSDRASAFAKAFDADPFSFELITTYRQYLGDGGSPAASSSSRGAAVRTVIESLATRRNREAGEGSVRLLAESPRSDGARFLRLMTLLESGALSEAREVLAQLPPGSRERRESERLLDQRASEGSSLKFLDTAAAAHTPSTDELLAVMRGLRDGTVSAEQNRKLDGLSFRSSIKLSSSVADSAETRLTTGEIKEVPFSFGREVTFQGRFEGNAILDYQIVGATIVDGRDALLLEPLGLRR